MIYYDLKHLPALALNMTYLTTLLLSFQILLYYCIDVLKQGWLSFYLTHCSMYTVPLFKSYICYAQSFQ